MDISVNVCNEFDAHCGRADRDENHEIIFGNNGVGILIVDAGADVMGGAVAPDISLFVNTSRWLLPYRRRTRTFHMGDAASRLAGIGFMAYRRKSKPALMPY